MVSTDAPLLIREFY